MELLIGHCACFGIHVHKFYIFFIFSLQFVYLCQSFHSPLGGMGALTGVRVSSSSLGTSPRNH